MTESSGMDIDDASLRLTIDIISAVRIDCYCMLRGRLAYCAMDIVNIIIRSKALDLRLITSPLVLSSACISWPVHSQLRVCRSPSLFLGQQ